jgi:hypothetical protein
MIAANLPGGVGAAFMAFPSVLSIALARMLMIAELVMNAGREPATRRQARGNSHE